MRALSEYFLSFRNPLSFEVFLYLLGSFSFPKEEFLVSSSTDSSILK